MSMATIDQKQKLNQQQLAILSSEMDKNKKSIGVAYFLLIILGWTGAHQFYLGKKHKGLLYLALFLLPFIVSFFMPFISLMLPEEVLYSIWSFVIVLPWIVAAILLIIDLFTIPSQTRKINEMIEDRIIRSLVKSALSSSNEGATNQVDKARDLSSLYGLKDD